MSNPKVIKPTVGRKVWYRKNPAGGDEEMAGGNNGEPLDATIVKVWNDGMVNLFILDANGALFRRTSVALLQEGYQPPGGAYCEWMPFQVGQAKASAKPNGAQLENRYMHHPPFGDQATRYGIIRNTIRETARQIVEFTPVSPEQARALDALDMAMMLANAAIARNEAPPITATAATGEVNQAVGDPNPPPPFKPTPSNV